jgi:hypothetical protein
MVSVIIVLYEGRWSNQVLTASHSINPNILAAAD